MWWITRISGGKSPSAAASTTGQRRLTRARMRRAPARAIDPARRRRPSQRAAGAMALVKTGGAVQQVAEEGGEADDDRAPTRSTHAPIYVKSRIKR